MKAGWTTKTIADVCSVVNGGTPKTGVSEYWDGAHQWITPAEMGKRSTPYVAKTERSITDAGIQNSSARLLPPLSVILSSRAPIGHLVINTEPMATNQGCKGLVPSDDLNHKYLYYYLSSIVQLLNDLGAGATFKELSGGKLKEVPIPLPQLAEQQRIVAILDEAFEAIAAARANAEQNRLNARALFESYLQSVFSQRGEGWIETTIAAATGGVFTGPFGSLLHKSDYIENGIPLVNPAHITNVGIEPDLRKTVSKATAQRLSSYIMRTGDIVIGRRGEMGRCAIVTDVEDGWLCGTGSFVIKPSDRCDARYLVRLLRSESCKNQLEKIAGGAVMPNLSNTDLSNFSIMLPPIDMQRSALDKIDTMAEETQRLESLYQRKIVALDELKQSLLQQAFSGQLDTTRQEVLTV
ncbi:restriction endonuclease subunit S [Aeromonas rivipollensis]|uniref:restriction endonuclease subunit S n=1 Tax=Aeromonas rivipollensis TaxID=948519 RepID=UPI003D1E4DDB